MALTTHHPYSANHPPHLVPRLKKEYSYTSTPSLSFTACSRANFTFTLYLYTTPCSLVLAAVVRQTHTTTCANSDRADVAPTLCSYSNPCMDIGYSAVFSCVLPDKRQKCTLFRPQSPPSKSFPFFPPSIP